MNEPHLMNAFAWVSFECPRDMEAVAKFPEDYRFAGELYVLDKWKFAAAYRELQKDWYAHERLMAKQDAERKKQEAEQRRLQEAEARKYQQEQGVTDKGLKKAMALIEEILERSA